MPAWPGGECPECGDLMPANLITCQTCRALLNPDLQISYVNIPEFIPLQEITSENAATITSYQEDKSRVHTATNLQLVQSKGAFVQCPGCREELKVPGQYLRSKVVCNYCNHQFFPQENKQKSQIVAVYADCPHCQKRIRQSLSDSHSECACSHCGNGFKMQPLS